jgi:hypothetical protein
MCPGSPTTELSYNALQEPGGNPQDSAWHAGDTMYLWRDAFWKPESYPYTKLQIGLWPSKVLFGKHNVIICII